MAIDFREKARETMWKMKEENGFGVAPKPGRVRHEA
jgi:hypothetical protein